MRSKKYTARFKRQHKVTGDYSIDEVRTIVANNAAHANKKAQGIAATNGWMIWSVGLSC